jgi:hypothetical protein
MVKKVGDSIHITDPKSKKLRGRVTTKGKKVPDPNKVVLETPQVEDTSNNMVERNDIEKAHNELEKLKAQRALNGQCLICGDSVKPGSMKFLNRQEAPKGEFITKSGEPIEYSGFLCADCAGITTSGLGTSSPIAKAEPVRATLESPEDILSAVPFLIGYQPANSLVIISLKDLQIDRAMRLDYPTADNIPSEAFDGLVSHLVRQNAQGAFVVAYTPKDCQNGNQMLANIAQALVRAEIPLHDAILVNHENKWRSTLCEDPQCCHPEGRDMPSLDSSQVSMIQVINGNPMPFASLEEMRDSISSLPLASDADFIALIDSLAVSSHEKNPQLRREGALAILDLFSTISNGSVPDNELCAKVIGSLGDIQVRDFALGSPGTDTLDTFQSMWKQLLRIAPEGYIAPVATLVAATAYENNATTLANACLERALEDDPEYVLARLCQRVFGRGWNPEELRSMRKELHPKICATIFEDE